MPPMRTSGRTADPVVRAKMLEGLPLGRGRAGRGGGERGVVPGLDEASYITGVGFMSNGGFLAI